MKLYEVTLHGTKIEASSDILRFGVETNYGCYGLHVKREGLWKELSVRCTFSCMGMEPVLMLLGGDGVIPVPPEATKNAISSGKIVFTGVDIEGEVRVATLPLKFQVLSTGPMDGEGSGGVTPSLLDQVTDIVGRGVRDMSEYEQKTRENAETAQNGANSATKSAAEALQSKGAAEAALHETRQLANTAASVIESETAWGISKLDAKTTELVAEAEETIEGFEAESIVDVRNERDAALGAVKKARDDASNALIKTGEKYIEDTSANSKKAAASEQNAARSRDLASTYSASAKNSLEGTKQAAEEFKTETKTALDKAMDAAEEAIEASRDAQVTLDILRQEMEHLHGIDLIPLEDGQYDPVTRIPLIAEPKANTFYLVPVAEPESAKLYDEWVYFDGVWEKFGTAKVDVNGLLKNKPSDWPVWSDDEKTAGRDKLGVVEYDDSELKRDLSQKLTEPAGAAVGQFFRVAAVDADGHYVLEAVDAPSGGVTDVRIDNKSVVTDGAAYVKLRYDGGIGYSSINGFEISNATNAIINSRSNPYATNVNKKPITSIILDYALKAAMCDGKGGAWAVTDQLGALDRLGITVDENGICHFG